ncbi:MAG: hypothetical protein OEV49_12885 [candidate division Zixibacteria bacterium]|nr:hypothetical protein [candidate division Zixibacteria bacterium]MDH3937900.1 hypothetical protein [candidate division Zixibacteria bacterium]MDH4034060.1 hypothetical protein [candidate division Zixibacteria bacterium]
MQDKERKTVPKKMVIAVTVLALIGAVDLTECTVRYYPTDLQAALDFIQPSVELPSHHDDTSHRDLDNAQNLYSVFPSLIQTVLSSS